MLKVLKRINRPRRRQPDLHPRSKRYFTLVTQDRFNSEWTPEKIAEAVATWHNWPGFSGESCGNCRATANVLAGGPGWFCPVCEVVVDTGDDEKLLVSEEYNCQSWSCHQMPHENPDYGPTLATIRASRKLLTYPPSMFRRGGDERILPFVRKKQEADRLWQVCVQRAITVDRPCHSYFQIEGTREEAVMWLDYASVAYGGGLFNHVLRQRNLTPATRKQFTLEEVEFHHLDGRNDPNNHYYC